MRLPKVVVIGFLAILALLIPPQTEAVIYVRQGTPGEAVVITDGQSYEGDIKEIEMRFEQGDGAELNISEIEKYVRPDMNALKSLTPKKISGNIVDANPASYTSSGVINPCNVTSSVDINQFNNTNQRNETESKESGWYHTEQLPDWYAKVRQTAKFFNFGILQKGSSLTKNLQDFREEETVLAEDALPPCVSATGTDMDSTEITITEQTLMQVVLTFFKNLINNISETSETADVTISNWKINSYGEAMAKTMTGNAGGSTAYLTGDDANQTNEAKGYVTALKPHGVVMAGTHGSQENFEVADTALVTNDTNFELMRENKEFHMCSYVPYKAQGLYVPDNTDGSEKCVFETGGSGGSCNGKSIPNLPEIDQSCSLCNTDGLTAFIKQYEPAAAGQLEDSFPETAIEILNAAASKFKIPAPVLLGAMIHEGAFTFDEYDWTENNVICWSVEGGRIGTTTLYDDSVCRSHQASTESRGPFGWFGVWFDNAVSAVISGLSILGIPGYEEFQSQHPNHDPCNFYDSAFAAAAAMSSSQAGRTDRAFTCSSSGGTVSTYTGNGGVVGSCSQWTKERVATVQAVHSPDGGCPAITTTVDAFLMFKCF